MKDYVPDPDPEVLTLRVSDLKSLLACPRSFALRVGLGLYPQPLKRLPPLEVAGMTVEEAAEAMAKQAEYDAAMAEEKKADRRDEGTLVHAVLERYYRGELDDARQSVQETILRKAEELSDDLGSESWQKAIEYATVMATGYLQWVADEGQDVGKEILAVETRLVRRYEIPLLNGNYRFVDLTGQLDIAERDTALKQVGIGDWKTVGKRGQLVRPNDFQLLAYASLWNHTYDEVPDNGFQVHILKSLQTSRAKPPFCWRFPITIGERKLKLFESHLGRLVIRAASVATLAKKRPDRLVYQPYSETPLCTQHKCPVLPVCDAMGSGELGRWQILANREFGGQMLVDPFDD